MGEVFLTVICLRLQKYAYITCSLAVASEFHCARNQVGIQILPGATLLMLFYLTTRSTSTLLGTLHRRCTHSFISIQSDSQPPPHTCFTRRFLAPCLCSMNCGLKKKSGQIFLAWIFIIPRWVVMEENKYLALFVRLWDPHIIFEMVYGHIRTLIIHCYFNFVGMSFW